VDPVEHGIEAAVADPAPLVKKGTIVVTIIIGMF
jgi:hypothetical protein